MSASLHGVHSMGHGEGDRLMARDTDTDVLRSGSRLGHLDTGVRPERPAGHMQVLPSHNADVILPLQIRKPVIRETIIAVGASTGGTDAIKAFLQPMPSIIPPIIITQHMPAQFTRSFASRLDTQCRIHVKEAEDEEPILPGTAYIAPGSAHLMLVMRNNKYHCSLSEGLPVNRHRPSVDVMFRSVANLAGANAVGVMLTGMGRDGAQGMLEMRQAGAYNFAQDEQSCVVFGMPKEAIAIGATHEVISLKEMTHRVLMVVAKRGR
ncbi:hypothetical protein KSF73_14785 [Burkholderiaceae bacterium DAT-1]|nr:hypothetical protein [Burkholderiaceae bacterium DAT-1]